MANGAATHLPLPQTPGPPAVQPGKPGIDLEIGQAVADATCTLAAAMLGYQQTGGLAPAVKEAGGEQIAKVVRLAMATAGELDFDAVARREGREALLPCLDAEFTPGHGEAVIDNVIDGVLLIVGRVLKFERAMAN